MDATRFLRAQFALADEKYLRITHGDIFQVFSRNKADGSMDALNVFTGERGFIPRPSENVYVQVHQQDIGYVPPVILVGSLSSHVHDLLLSRSSKEFGSAVPHTTRPKRIHERNGLDYWFVRSSTMDQMVSNGLFIDAGRLGEHSYGTTEASIRNVAQREKKHCLLDNSTCIPRLLNRGLFPLVIFVGAQSWRQLQDVLSFDGGSEYQARELFVKDDAILSDMELYLNAVVREPSLDASYARIVEIVRKQSKNPVWIPESGDPKARLI